MYISQRLFVIDLGGLSSLFFEVFLKFDKKQNMNIWGLATSATGKCGTKTPRGPHNDILS